MNTQPPFGEGRVFRCRFTHAPQTARYAGGNYEYEIDHGRLVGFCSCFADFRLCAVFDERQYRRLRRGQHEFSQRRTAGGELKGMDQRWAEKQQHCLQKNPNEFAGKTNLVQITKTNDQKLEGNSVESADHRNYISIYNTEDKKVYWIPFEAISRITFKKAQPTTLTDARIDEEIFGRFRFEKDPYPSSSLTCFVEVTLLYQLPGGQRTTTGYLIDAFEKLRLFNSKEWIEVPWESVSAIELRWGEPSKKQLPPFVYRSIGNYSNVWREYELPK